MKEPNETPKQVELTPEQGKTLNAAIDQLNQHSLVSQERVKLYTELATRERESLGRALAMHQMHVAGIVRAAGLDPKDFTQHGVVEDAGKWYLRPQQQQ